VFLDKYVFYRWATDARLAYMTMDEPAITCTDEQLADALAHLHTAAPDALFRLILTKA
jgi:hypothetical protein